MFLLPSRLRELLQKKKGSTSRVFNADHELLAAVREAAQQQGRTEDEIWMEFARAGQEQFEEINSLEYCWEQKLSEREQEVTALACLGYRNHEIADILSISPETVKSHLKNIYNKFGIRGKRELCRALKDWQFQEWWENR